VCVRVLHIGAIDMDVDGHGCRVCRGRNGKKREVVQLLCGNGIMGNAAFPQHVQIPMLTLVFPAKPLRAKGCPAVKRSWALARRHFEAFVHTFREDSETLVKGISHN